MKSTVVPAQITTVEDKIAGNLSVTQLMLLIAPVMLTGLLFAIVPPMIKLTAIKLTVALVFAFVCLTLAVRIKGTLLLNWLIIIGRYNLRPRRYVLDKNDSYLRYIEPAHVNEQSVVVKDEAAPQVRPLKQQLAASEVIRLQTAIDDPRSQFQLFTSKGGLHVRIQQIKEDSV